MFALLRYELLSSSESRDGLKKRISRIFMQPCVIDNSEAKAEVLQGAWLSLTTGRGKTERKTELRVMKMTFFYVTKLYLMGSKRES